MPCVCARARRDKLYAELLEGVVVAAAPKGVIEGELEGAPKELAAGVVRLIRLIRVIRVR
jgi:hypothetical protein